MVSNFTGVCMCVGRRGVYYQLSSFHTDIERFRPVLCSHVPACVHSRRILVRNFANYHRILPEITRSYTIELTDTFRHMFKCVLLVLY